MAAADSQEDTDLSLFNKETYETFLKTFYDQFVTGAFDFYTANADIWGDFERDHLYYILGDEEFYNFTTTARQAVVTLAYFFRETYRRRFEKILRQLRNTEIFIKLVLGYPLNKGQGFLDFLSWIAYFFELNLFCKIHKIDYEDISKSCFNSYPGFSYFKVGTPDDLEEACNSIGCFYFPLVKTFRGYYPSCDISLPFTHAVGIVDREIKYDSTFLKIVMLHGSVDRDYENLELEWKFYALLSYNPERIALGYMSRNKIKRHDQIKKLSVESSEIDRNLNLAEETQQCIEASLEASPRKVTPNEKFILEFHDARSFFVVTDRYLLKRREEARHNAYESEVKRNIKLFSLETGQMELAENLMNVLDENIEKNNLYKITDGVFAVYPLNSDSGNFSDKIYVLDTSSDDDDDPQLDPNQRVFMRHVTPVLRKWKYCTSSDNIQLKRLYEFRQNVKYEVRPKPPREEVSETDMQSTGAIPKEMNSTEQNQETKKKKKRSRKKKQKEKISMENTEATPQDINSIKSSFETAKAISLPGNAREEKSTGTEKNNSIQQTFQKLLRANPLLRVEFCRKVLEKHIAMQRELANNGQVEISAMSTGAKGKYSIGQNLEKSRSTIGDTEQEEISQRNTGAMPEKQKSSKEHKNSSKQSSKKSNSACQTIQPVVEDKDEMNTMADMMEKIELSPETSTGTEGKNYVEQILEEWMQKNPLIATEVYEELLEKYIGTEYVSANTWQEEISAAMSTGATGKNSIGQNLEKSESTIGNAQREEISNTNTGAIPKRPKPPKEHKNSSKQPSKKSNSACQTSRPKTKDKDVMK